MKAKLTVKNSKGVSTDQSRFLSMAPDALQKIRSSHYNQLDCKEMMFEDFTNEGNQTILKVLKNLIQSCPMITVRFKGCNLSDQFIIELIDYIQTRKVCIESIICAENDLNTQFTKVYLAQLLARNSKNNFTISKFSLSFETFKDSGYAHDTKTRAKVKVSNVGGLLPVQEELANYLESLKEIAIIKIEFETLDDTKKLDFLSWLSSLAVKPAVEVVLQEKNVLTMELSHINARNRCCSYDEKSNSFRIFCGYRNSGEGINSFRVDELDSHYYRRFFEKNPSITEISLSHCSASKESWGRFLAQILQLKLLNAIILKNVCINADSIKIFGEMLHQNTNLSTLTLSDVEIAEDGLSRIIQSLCSLEKLTTIQISNITLVDADLVSLSKLPYLTELSLPGVSVSDDVVINFVSFFENPSVRKIDFSCTNINRTLLIDVVAKGSVDHTLKFYFSESDSYRITQEQRKNDAIETRNAELRKLKESKVLLKSLRFDNVMFSDICISILIEYIRANPNVEEISLNGNILSENGFKQLFEGISSCENLSVLDLSSSRVAPSVKSIVSLLAYIPCLAELRLIGTQINLEALFNGLRDSEAMPLTKVVVVEPRVEQKLQSQSYSYSSYGYQSQVQTPQPAINRELTEYQNKFDKLQIRNDRLYGLLPSDDEAAATELTALDFNGLYFTDQCINLLCNYVRAHKTVTTIRLGYNHLTPQGIRVLCNTLVATTHVNELNLSGTQNPDQWLKECVDTCIKSPKIAILDLSSINLNHDEMIRCLTQSKLLKLRVSSNSTFFERVRDDRSMMTTEIVTENPDLNIKYERVRSRNHKLIRCFTSEHTDLVLDLSQSEISTPIVELVCNALVQNPELREFSVDSNNLSDSDLCKLLDAISKHPNIRKLIISNNVMGEQACSKLKEYLRSTSVLHQLVMCAMNISEIGITKICEALEENSSLLMLDVSQNTNGLKCLPRFSKALRRNNTLSKFICLDTQFPSDPGVHRTKTSFGKGQQADASYAAHIEIVNEYKRYVTSSRALIVDFQKEVSRAKNNNKDIESPNTSLLECELVHAEVFTRSLGGNTKVPTSPLPKYLQLNRTLGVSCSSCISEIAKTTDKEKLGELYNKLKENVGKGVSPYFSNENGNTLVHLAAFCQDIEPTNLLLSRQKNFDVHIFNDQNQSPPQIANASGNQAVLELLKYPEKAGLPTDTQNLKASAKKPEKKKAKIDTAQAIVQVANNTEQSPSVIGLPLSAELTAPSPSKKLKTDGEPDNLHLAIGAVDIWQILQAVSSENLMGLKFILGQNPAILSQHFNGETLLHFAVAARKPSVVELLVESGADTNLANQTGRMPLFCLLDDCLKKNYTLEYAQIAKILLEKGALIYDEDDQTFALHLAIRTGILRLVKLILGYNGDINKKNKDNHTALTLAVLLNHIEILEILLLCPELQKETLEHALKYSEREKTSQGIVLMLSSRLKKPFLSQKENTHWMKDMRVCFGASSAHNVLLLDSRSNHLQLMLQNKFSSSILKTRKKAKPDPEEEAKFQKEEEGNPVTICFTFIVSTQKHLSGAHNTRDSITITFETDDDSFIENHLTKDDDGKVIPSDEIRRKVRERANRGVDLSKKDPSQQKYESPDNIIDENKLVKERFEALFHHGEQSLVSAAEQMKLINIVIKKLLAHPRFIAGCKVYGLILDIHSPRYVCSNCEIAILSMQDPQNSPFIVHLAQSLKQMGCALPFFSPLRMVTRVGSYQAYEREEVKYDEHLDLCLDMRFLNNRIILQQDLVTTAGSVMQFNSRAE